MNAKQVETTVDQLFVQEPAYLFSSAKVTGFAKEQARMRLCQIRACPNLRLARNANSSALLQKLPKFLNCEQLFGSRPRSRRVKDAGRVQGFFGFHVRR